MEKKRGRTGWRRNFLWTLPGVSSHCAGGEEVCEVHLLESLYTNTLGSEPFIDSSSGNADTFLK